MILLVKGSEIRQYWGLNDNQIAELVDRGYRVFRFDGSQWRFLEYTKPMGWEEVPIETELYPKEKDERRTPRS